MVQKKLRVRLFIQIPCLNEREWLAQTFADLPRSIPGVDSRTPVPWTILLGDPVQ